MYLKRRTSVCSAIEIKSSYTFRFGGLAALGLFFIGPLAIITTGKLRQGQPLGLLPPVLVAVTIGFLAPILLLFAARRSSARFLDERGVTTHAGKQYAWSDFREARAIHYKAVLDHYQLVFSTGKVPIYFRAAQNPAEIHDFMRAVLAGTHSWLPHH